MREKLALAARRGTRVRIFRRFHQPRHFVLTRGVPNVVLVGRDGVVLRCDAYRMQERILDLHVDSAQAARHIDGR